MNPRGARKVRSLAPLSCGERFGGHERADVNEARLDAGGRTHHFELRIINCVAFEARFMLRRIVICLIVAVAALTVADAANARQRHQINPTPFSHAPCSVLDGQPCAPSFCSVFNHGPCIPEIEYPYGENLQLTIETVPSHDEAAKYQKPDHDLNTIGDLFAELRSCWSPPPADSARQGMQMSVRFSFKRSGEMIGTPFMTYATEGVSADTRATYLKAINASLDACLPMKFTGDLGGALAGRPIAIRYVDNRELGKQSATP
jgi:hypothetical protein